MELAALIIIQLVATAVGFGLLWRKLDQVGADVARVKRMLETLELMRFSSGAQRRAAQPTRSEPALATNTEPPSVRASDDDPFSAAWVRPGARVPREEITAPPSRALPARTPPSRQVMANEIGDEVTGTLPANLSPESGRLIAAAAMALAPVLGFAIGAPPAALIACGLVVSAALMFISLRPDWTSAAFVGAFGAGAWALTAFAIESAQAAPITFSVFSAVAGVTGLAHARLRSLAPGLLMALLMGAALLALGNAVGLAGAAGIGYVVLVAVAAILGASTDRLAGLHLGAFAAAMFGLFVFSGQEAAAIWFTPAATWLGALFFGIAAIRVPMVGERGAMSAATGVAAPLLSLGALSLSAHGLANPLAAAGAFLALTLMFGALIIVAAQWRQRGVAGLRLTVWILLGGGLIAFATAALLALPAPFAAAAIAAGAVGLAARDHYKPQRIWRAGALALLILASLVSWGTVSVAWPDGLTILAALIVPSLLAAAAAFISRQRASAAAAAIFEAFAILGAWASAIALVRFIFTAGAPSQALIGFVEAGVHITLWAGGSLLLAFYSESGASLVRRASAAILGATAFCAAVLAGLLWLTPFWSARAPSGIDLALFQHAPLGFALPAIAAWAHWAFWRGRGVVLRTRFALATASLLTAAFIALEVIGARHGAVAAGQFDWILILVVVTAFSAAIGVNFAPGVTDETSTRSRLDKYFQRNRRGEQRI